MNEQYREAAQVAFDGAVRAAKAECRDRHMDDRLIDESCWPRYFSYNIAYDIAHHELGPSGPTFNRLPGLVGPELHRLFKEATRR